MTDILIVRHTPENHVGVFASVLDSMGLQYQYLEAYQPEFRQLPAFENALERHRPKGIVVLGGPQHALDDELSAERAWLKRLIEQDIPIFGVCLGSQMLAAVLGGTVDRNRYQEVGWVEIIPTAEGQRDPVFSRFADRLNRRQFHWHNDSFTLPPGAISLATSETCPQQAFRYGERVMAVQFHPEVSLDVIDAWLDESTSITSRQKTALKNESAQALDVALPNSPVQSSLALFKAFCQARFL